jgi:hypothetical protein
VTSADNTFAGQLRHFARSVDIVDDRVFERVRMLMYKYVKDELGAAYFELMRGQAMGNEPGLRMFWSSEEKDHSWPIKQADGSYTNLVTLAYGKEQPLWIVGQDRRPLNEAENLEDQWSHNLDLPPYQSAVDHAARTLVALPLRRQRSLGVCYFETLSDIGITEVAKVELQRLADATSILLELYEANLVQTSMTSAAIFELQERLERAKFPQLTRPHFFLAFSSQADKQVTTVIQEVLRTFSVRLEFTDWTRMHESGNVNVQIAKEITRSRFGICYLSEPAKVAGEPGIEYLDNPNVLFEAGMLHARTAANEAEDGSEPTGWIPIREPLSPPAPFDFSTERILKIPRFDDGGLNEDRLRQVLTERVTKLLGSE